MKTKSLPYFALCFKSNGNEAEKKNSWMRVFINILNIYILYLYLLCILHICIHYIYIYILYIL
jgi:hypothetical protein